MTLPITDERIDKVMEELNLLARDYDGSHPEPVIFSRNAYDLVADMAAEREDFMKPAISGMEFRQIDGVQHKRWTAKGPWLPTGEDES